MNIIIPPINMPDAIKQALGTIWQGKIPKNIETICYTYGDNCYTAQPLSLDLIEHESVHTKQQGDNPDAWWNKYGTDPVFRYQQELEAYTAQLAFLKKLHNRNVFMNIAKNLAKDMASPMYGNMCTKEKALFELLKVL